jgi:hypothetical protein
MKKIIYFLDPCYSKHEYSELQQQSKGIMDETRLKVRMRTYLEETKEDLSKNGAPPLTPLMVEEIELAYERGYKEGQVDATRKETPTDIPLPLNTRLN